MRDPDFLEVTLDDLVRGLNLPEDTPRERVRHITFKVDTDTGSIFVSRGVEVGEFQGVLMALLVRGFTSRERWIGPGKIRN